MRSALNIWELEHVGLSFPDVEAAIDANSFIKFSWMFGEKEAKRSKITVGTAQDLAMVEEYRERFENNEEAMAIEMQDRGKDAFGHEVFAEKEESRLMGN